MRVTFADNTTEDYKDISIGGGTEGDVYVSVDGRSAVKLYRNTNQAFQAKTRNRLEKLIERQHNPTADDPYWRDFFAWPEKIVVKPQIGYRMPFVGGMKQLAHYIFPASYKRLKPEEKGWFIGRIAVAIKLVAAANRMSAMGLCYPDFSENNVLVDPFDGRMMLIDCDSIAITGALPPEIEGTSIYRAPEIVTHAVTEPTISTDRHALAVLLYYWLLERHPLDGRKVFDASSETNDGLLRFGKSPIYVEHPTNTTNRPSGQYIPATALGSELAELFEKTFVDGIHQPGLRPQPTRYLDALHHIYDRIIPCNSPNCSWRFFVAKPTPGLICPLCGTAADFPTELPFLYLMPHKNPNQQNANINDYENNTSKVHSIVGWPGRTIQSWHVDVNTSPRHRDATHKLDRTPRAVFEYDPQKNIWAIRNLALPSMQFRGSKDGHQQWRSWPLQATFPLEHGMLIQFGNSPTNYRAKITITKVK